MKRTYKIGKAIVAVRISKTGAMAEVWHTGQFGTNISTGAPITREPLAFGSGATAKEAVRDAIKLTRFYIRPYLEA
jgi:hypothetical protein